MATRANVRSSRELTDPFQGRYNPEISARILRLNNTSTKAESCLIWLQMLKSFFPRPSERAAITHDTDYIARVDTDFRDGPYYSYWMARTKGKHCGTSFLHIQFHSTPKPGHPFGWSPAEHELIDRLKEKEEYGLLGDMVVYAAAVIGPCVRFYAYEGDGVLVSMAFEGGKEVLDVVRDHAVIANVLVSVKADFV